MAVQAQELQAIRNTLATYAVAGDRMQLEVLAATFMPEGVLETPAATFRGRDAIVHGLGRATSEPAQTVPRATFVRHHLTTSMLDVRDPGLAEGRTYFVVFTDIGPDHAGCYSDKLRKSGDQWLFEHRRVMIDWVSEATLFPALLPAYRARRAR